MMNAKEFIDQAKKQIEGKRYVFIEEWWYPVKLSVIEGTNEYNTSISLVDKEGGCKADFYNGAFWSRCGRNLVDIFR